MDNPNKGLPTHLKILSINAHYVYKGAISIYQISTLSKTPTFPKSVAFFVMGKSNQTDFINTLLL